MALGVAYNFQEPEGQFNPGILAQKKIQKQKTVGGDSAWLFNN